MLQYRRGSVKAKNHLLESLKPKILKGITFFSNFWELVHHLQEPIPFVAQTLAELQEEGYIQSSQGNWFLTEKGKKVLSGLSPAVPFKMPCPHCSGTGLDMSKYQKVYEEFRVIAQERPRAIMEYDQGYITPDGTIARVQMMDAFGDLEGKAILLLGDDDLVSIALMLTRKPERIVVLEIDDRLIDFIARSAGILGFSALEVRKSDLREPLPDDLIGKFDVFETDPTESYWGFRMFLSRGAVSLRGLRCAGYFGLTRLESSLWKWKKMQQFLLRLGFVFTAILPDFHLYEHWDYHPSTRAAKLIADPVPENFFWYTSALVRIEKISGANIPNVACRVKGPKLYRDEESSTS